MTPPLPVLVLTPLLAALLAGFLPSARAIRRLQAAVAIALAAFAFLLAADVVSAGPLDALYGLLYADALSAYFLVVLGLVLLATHGGAAIDGGAQAEPADLPEQRRDSALVLAMIAALVLALLADRVVLLWASFQAAALSAGILLARGRTAETAWTHRVVALAAAAIALLGTLLLTAARVGEPHGAVEALGPGWSAGRSIGFDPALALAALLLLVAGFGVHAGLASLPSWLAAAQERAPAELAVVLSVALGNTAIYALLRFQAMVTPALGPDVPARVLATAGLASLLIAAACLLFRQPFSRRIAHASFAHLAFVVFAAGIGGAAAIGGLIHLLNHALGKTLVLLAAPASARPEGKEGAARPAAAVIALAVGLFALAGLPPAGSFLSAFAVLSAAYAHGSTVAATVIVIAAAACGLPLIRSRPEAADPAAVAAARPGSLRRGVLVVLAAAVIGLGLGLPRPLQRLVLAAAGTLRPVVMAPPPAPIPGLPGSEGFSTPAPGGEPR